MKNRHARTLGRCFASICAVAVLVAGVAGSAVSTRVSAATAGSLYSYNFATTTLTSPVPNGAAANAGVGLNLYGSWSQSAFGIHFAGDKSSSQSVAYAKPVSGNTISVAGSQAFGGVIKFKYQAPVDATCFTDSANLTQIGRFGTGLSQIKLQFSDCGTSTTSVFPECRIAGANSTTSDVPVTGTQGLVDGATYVLACVKGPDPASGQATLQLKTVRVDSGLTTTDTFGITPTGTISSTAYLSVGNKYALPALSANTDQFVGDVAKVAYCAASTTTALNTCLDTEVPVQAAPQPPQPVEYVGNQSVETDMTGWAGKYNTTSSNSRVAGGYSGSYSLRSINNTTKTGSTGFIDKPRWFDGSAGKATVVGKVYTGSVWVRADASGQSLKLYLRERNAAGSTVGSKTVTISSTGTGWAKLTNDYTAKGTGNSIGFYVYASNVAAKKGFNADMMSLVANP